MAGMRRCLTRSVNKCGSRSQSVPIAITSRRKQPDNNRTAHSSAGRRTVEIERRLCPRGHGGMNMCMTPQQRVFWHARKVSDKTESQSGRSCGATHRPSAFRGFRCTHDADLQTTTRPQCYEHQGLDSARASRFMLKPKKATKREPKQEIRGPRQRKFIYRHHEDTRLKLCDTDNETFPIPVKYADVMRQTQTSIKNVCENIINELWTEAKGVTLSEEWTGTTSFQIPQS